MKCIFLMYWFFRAKPTTFTVKKSNRSSKCCKYTMHLLYSYGKKIVCKYIIYRSSHGNPMGMYGYYVWSFRQWIVTSDGFPRIRVPPAAVLSEPSVSHVALWEFEPGSHPRSDRRDGGRIFMVIGWDHWIINRHAQWFVHKLKKQLMVK